ncbi:MAG: helix-turn-helix domain-containing protein, partial [Candidatus Rokuibacteriota bacterium]
RLLVDEFEVLDASDWAGAERLLRSRPVDLALVGLPRPFPDATALPQGVRALSPAVPVIVVSAAVETRSAVVATRSGASDYVTPSMDAEELRLAIRAALQRHSHAAASGLCSVALPVPPNGRARVVAVGADHGLLAAVAVAFRVRADVFITSKTATALEQLNGRAAAPGALILDDGIAAADRSSLARSFHVRFPEHPVVLVTGAGHRSRTVTEPGTTSGYVVTTSHCAGDVLELMWALLDPGTADAKCAPRGSTTLAVVDVVARQYAQSITIDSLAREVGRATRHLARVFQREMYDSVHRFVATVRLEVAKLILRDEDTKLDVIAERVGFCDASHLSSAFRAYENLRPGEYRRHWRDVIAGRRRAWRPSTDGSGGSRPPRRSGLLRCGDGTTASGDSEQERGA